MYCRVFNSTLGLCPLMPVATSLLCDSEEMSPGAKSPKIANHCTANRLLLGCLRLPGLSEGEWIDGFLNVA